MTAHELLAELGATLKLEAEWDASDAFSFYFDEDAVDIEVVGKGTQEEHLLLSAYIGDMPMGDRVPLLERMLAANLYGQETGAVSLGLDVQNDEALLQRAIAMPMAYENFEKALERFITMMQYWKKEWQILGDAAENQPPSENWSILRA